MRINCESKWTLYSDTTVVCSDGLSRIYYASINVDGNLFCIELLFTVRSTVTNLVYCKVYLSYIMWYNRHICMLDVISLRYTYCYIFLYIQSINLNFDDISTVWMMEWFLKFDDAYLQYKRWTSTVYFQVIIISSRFTNWGDCLFSTSWKKKYYFDVLRILYLTRGNVVV